MIAFYFHGTGGIVPRELIAAEIELPPGKYVIHFNASISISSQAPMVLGSRINTFAVTLSAGEASDIYCGAFQFLKHNALSSDAQNAITQALQRPESVALQIATDLPAVTKAIVKVESRVPNPAQYASRFEHYVEPELLYVWSPRLSAIQVDELQIIEPSAPPEDRGEDRAERLLMAIRTGVHKIFSN